jgi:hypothetical protein
MEVLIQEVGWFRGFEIPHRIDLTTKIVLEVNNILHQLNAKEPPWRVEVSTS